MDLCGFSLIFPHLSYELQSTFGCLQTYGLNGYDCLEVSINGASNRWMVYFMENPNLKSGGWYTHPSEKYELVGWDDDIPNCFWKVIQNSMVPNHQPENG